ncbi:hypothetical protein HG535_0C01480 [Zygotorulaspora mrakii]|uniref:Uncharacterized protein n=1 Tax=Zygotorulaspora mrakii TaxID=42260 RepID=A0A7H9B1F8_ZYGMR|nr:uncharacterized protein HG535_0C01480 [Zygotorulaspora mrakii]QLG71799.1 hypothetical protein HG535_0C01480 [Zygotorulaspora mrakii]
MRRAGGDKYNGRAEKWSNNEEYQHSITNSKRHRRCNDNRAGLPVLSVNKFMVWYFTKNILSNYSRVFLSSGSTTEAEYENKVSKILETILKRAQSTNLHFKKICCIVIKFAESCNADTNYMKFLKYDFLKLLVVSFVFTDRRKGILDFNLYSRITGMPVEEIKNCCLIVRPVLMKHRGPKNETVVDGTPGTIGTRQLLDCGIEQSAGTISVEDRKTNGIVSVEESGVEVHESDIENFNKMGIKMVKEYLNLA